MILSIYVCVFSVKSSVFMRSIFQTFTVMQIEEDERENEERGREREKKKKKKKTTLKLPRHVHGHSVRIPGLEAIDFLPWTIFWFLPKLVCV